MQRRINNPVKYENHVRNTLQDHKYTSVMTILDRTALILTKRHIQNISQTPKVKLFAKIVNIPS